MYSTMATTFFDDDSKRNNPVQDFSLEDYPQRPTRYEANMLANFFEDKQTKQEFEAKTIKASKLLKNLFKKDSFGFYLQWREGKGFFLTCLIPYAIEGDSLEQEVIDYYFKNATLTSDYLLAIPYNSL